MEGYFLQAPAVRQTALARLGVRGFPPIRTEREWMGQLWLQKFGESEYSRLMIVVPPPAYGFS